MFRSTFTAMPRHASRDASSKAIRKLGLDALATSVRSGERLPDVGGPDLHPTAGACCVGVRDFLAAFNVQIAGENATVAKRIARAVRESTGGLPGVKALGLYLESQRVAQVSMNVTDLGQLSLDTVYSAVCREADEPEPRCWVANWSA